MRNKNMWTVNMSTEKHMDGKTSFSWGWFFRFVFYFLIWIHNKKRTVHCNELLIFSIFHDWIMSCVTSLYLPLLINIKHRISFETI